MNAFLKPGLLISLGLLALSLSSCVKKADPLKEYTYQEKEIHVQRDTLDLYGEAYIPESGLEKMPLVIMCHGYNGNVNNCRAYADSLSRKGYATYRFDFAGGGSRSKSSGSSKNMSIFTEREDLEAVLEAAKGWDFVDKEKIYLMGESQGGMVSAITAPLHSKDIQGLMLLYPALCIPDDAIRSYGTKANVPETIPMMNLEIGYAYYKDLFDFNVYEAIKGYSKDVVLIHGDKDGLVPFSYSQKADEIYKHSRLVSVEGAGHGFRGLDQTLVKGYLTDFMLSHEANQ